MSGLTVESTSRLESKMLCPVSSGYELCNLECCLTDNMRLFRQTSFTLFQLRIRVQSCNFRKILTRKQVRTRLSYRPARLHRLAVSIPNSKAASNFFSGFPSLSLVNFLQCTLKILLIHDQEHWRLS
jgi:hypothetical protein